MVGQRGVGSSSPTLSVWSPAPTSPTLLCCPCHRAKLTIALGVSLARRLPSPPLLLVGSLFSVSVWSSGAAGAPLPPQQQKEKEWLVEWRVRVARLSRFFPPLPPPAPLLLSSLRGLRAVLFGLPLPPVASCLVRLPRFAAIDSSVASKQQQPTKGLLFLLGARALSLPRLVPSSLCSRGR